jgi:hypothetical protein
LKIRVLQVAACPLTEAHYCSNCQDVGPTGGHYRHPAGRVPQHTSFRSRQRLGCATTHRHVSCTIGSSLPAEVGSKAATCLAALEPASQPRWDMAPPRVMRHRTRLEGSRASRVPWLQIYPLYGEGSGLPCVLWSPMGRGP